MKTTSVIFVFVMMIVIGCAASRHYVPIPQDLDMSTVLRDAIAMTAEHFHFTPEVVRVKAGTLLRLSIDSIDGTHGFRLSDFDIDKRLDEHVLETVEVYFPEKGEFTFRCSHFCGLGHFGMAGKIIVE